MIEFHQVLTDANNVLARIPWQAIVASGILSPVAAALNKWWNVQKDITKFSVVFVVGTAGAGINYLLHVPTHDPSIILLQGAILTFFAQPFYFLVVKPGRGKITNWFDARVSAASKLNADIKSAALPTDTSPVDLSH